MFFLIYFSNLSTEERENYFLLCDVLPEDRILREELQKQRLVRIVFKGKRRVGNTYKNHFHYGFFFSLLIETFIHAQKSRQYMKILKQKKVYP